jgi:protein phosphatase
MGGSRRPEPRSENDEGRRGAPVTEPIEVPVPGLVVLVGAAGSGKTTLAARLFEPSEILSSDALREVVSGDPGDQRATGTAFSILHREARRRLAAGRLVVVDATNVEARARKELLQLSHASAAPSIAVVILAPAEVVHARNAGRPGRVVPADIVDRHLARLTGLGRMPADIADALRAEGFGAVHVLVTADSLDGLRIVRRVNRP